MSNDLSIKTGKVNLISDSCEKNYIALFDDAYAQAWAIGWQVPLTTLDELAKFLNQYSVISMEDNLKDMLESQFEQESVFDFNGETVTHEQAMKFYYDIGFGEN